MEKSIIEIKELTQRLNSFFSRPRSHSTVKKALVMLFGLVVVVSTYFLSTPFVGEYHDFKLGDIALEDIRVKSDIRYELTEETKKLRNEAFEKERLVFDRDYESLLRVVDSIKTEMHLLKLSAMENTSINVIKDRLAFLKNRALYPIKGIRETLALPEDTGLSDWAARYATLIFENYGFLGETPKKEIMTDLNRVGAIIRTINTSGDVSEIIWDGNHIVPQTKVFNRYYTLRLSSLAEPAFEAQLPESTQKLIIHRLMQLYTQNPMVQYNEMQTLHRKKMAATSVAPVTAFLKKGRLIARSGEIIDSNKLEKITILNQYQSETNFRFIIGIFLVMGALAVSSAFYILRFSEGNLRDLSMHITLHSLLLSFFLYGFVLSWFESITESKIYFGLLIPLGYFGIIGGLILGARVTLLAGLYASIYFFLLSNYDIATLLLGITSVIIGIYAGARMQKRTQFFKGAINLFLANALIVIGIGLIQSEKYETIAFLVFIGLLNAIVCHILVSGVLPLYEAVFNLPTKFRLMELSDFNHPLLKRMAAEASSSYQHSLMMASLSERAVAEIGGDTLLTRVGCLYHDIGKMLNPHFYAENKHLSPTSENFNKLGPLKSAQMIIAHVSDGIKMARSHRLPEKIIDFIPEHHGTTTIQYFYHQALKEKETKMKSGSKQNASISIDKESFQYPGPKPKSRETGVVMIADSVEAASRTVEKPGREVFEKLIDRIIENKMNEDQFDDCPLTLSDLKKIKESFVHVLISSYHSRPKYPSMDKTKALESKVQERKKPSKPKASRQSKPKAAPAKAKRRNS